MKKVITVLLVLTAGIINVQANGSDRTDPVSKVVTASFSKEFSSAKDVSWSWIKEEELFKATFNYHSKKLNAYFTREGEFVGTSRYIPFEQLPLIIVKALQQHYSDFKVQTVIENTAPGETNYYITMDGTKYAIMVKANSNGDMSKFKKIKKIY